MAAAGLSFCLAACQLLATLHEAPLRDAGAPASDGGLEAETGLVFGPCPTAPPPVDDPLNGITSADMVASYLSLDVTKLPEDVKPHLCAPAGDDLDGIQTKCHDPNAPMGCVWDPTSATPPCDGPNGSDNALSSLIGTVSSLGTLGGVGGSVAKRFDPAIYIREGLINVIFRVTQYNDLENDPSVEVAVGVSAGITRFIPEVPSNDGPPDISALPIVWDGEKRETWSWDTRAVDSRNEPTAQATAAYVAHGILVADFPSAPLPLGGLSSGLPVRRARVVGNLVKRNGGYYIEHGRLTGAVRTRDLLQVIGTINGSGVPELCSPDAAALYAIAESEVCQSADLSAAKGSVCDELSIGLSFYAVPGDIAPNPAVGRFNNTAPCDGGWVAPECAFISEWQAAHPDGGDAARD